MPNDINKIKKLRQSTGAGFKDCSAALQEGNGNIEKARILINEGVDLNSQDETGRTALMWAIFRDDKEIVALPLLLPVPIPVPVRPVHCNSFLLQTNNRTPQELLRCPVQFSTHLSSQYLSSR